MDDYFPFTYSRAGKEIFAFAKCKHGENELWVQLVEKAWAKLCGSYESAEMGRCNEFFSNFDGSPTETLWTDDHETEQGEEELFRILNQCDKNNYVMTGSILKSMKKETKDKPQGYLKELGLKNCHSYTIIDVREITLDNSDIEYLLFLRNPTGNLYNKDDEVWKGDWSPLSDKWTPRTRRQCNYHVTEKLILEAKARGRAELRAFKTEANQPKRAAKKKKKKKPVSEKTESE